MRTVAARTWPSRAVSNRELPGGLIDPPDAAGLFPSHRSEYGVGPRTIQRAQPTRARPDGRADRSATPAASREGATPIPLSRMDCPNRVLWSDTLLVTLRPLRWRL